MAFNFANARKTVRRVVHNTFAASALYAANSVSTPTIPCKARWHSKIDRVGNLDNEGWAQVIEGIDRIIFNVDQARSINVARNGKIAFPDLPGFEFILDTKEDADGPEEETWLVSRA